MDYYSDVDENYILANDFTYKVHSPNPVGKKNIISLLNRYLEYKNFQEKKLYFEMI